MALVPQNILKWMCAEDRRKYAKGQMTVEEVYESVSYESEKKEHERFISWLRRNDLDYIHSRMDKRPTIKAGTLDFHVWKGPKHCFVEFKSEHGKLRPAQQEFLVRQQERGTPALVSRDYMEAARFVIDALGLERGETLVSLAQQGRL